MVSIKTLSANSKIEWGFSLAGYAEGGKPEPPKKIHSKKGQTQTTWKPLHVISNTGIEPRLKRSKEVD